MKQIRVNIADYAVSAGPITLATIGLGSCVAIVLHDACAGVGAMAHVLLPNEALSRERDTPGKFASTAVPAMLTRMRELGARDGIGARLVGGASMFGSLLPVGAPPGFPVPSSLLMVPSAVDVPSVVPFGGLLSVTRKFSLDSLVLSALTEIVSVVLACPSGMVTGPLGKTLLEKSSTLAAVFKPPTPLTAYCTVAAPDVLPVRDTVNVNDVGVVVDVPSLLMALSAAMLMTGATSLSWIVPWP